jgi:hypothetical protein
LGFSVLGLVFSFAAFLHSLRPGPNAPPVLASLILALFHAAFMGISLVLYVLFLLPASDQTVPALTQTVSDPTGRLIAQIPDGWQSSPILTDPEPGLTITPAAGEDFLTFQEIKIQLKKNVFVDGKKPAAVAEEPVVKIFAVKKFWFRFYQVTVVDYKTPDTLCSVSTVVLPPHLTLAQDLCKAVFKKIKVPVTIKQ